MDTELLAEGERVAPFTLPEAHDTSASVYWNEVAHDRRVVVLSLTESEEPDDTGRPWLTQARGRVAELEERDLTVLVLARDPDALSEAADLPAPTFRVLRDAYTEAITRLGGAPAFYLVGKDGTIKRASRSAPPLDDLFALIDGMPMRRAERAAGG